MAKIQKKKKANKHASNIRRQKRKAMNSKRTGKGGWTEKSYGKCGSSFCSKLTGCEPWE